MKKHVELSGVYRVHGQMYVVLTEPFTRAGRDAPDSVIVMWRDGAIEDLSSLLLKTEKKIA
jgi:hypothetical protein